MKFGRASELGFENEVSKISNAADTRNVKPKVLISAAGQSM